MNREDIIKGNILIAKFMNWSERSYHIADGSTFKGWNTLNRDFDEFLFEDQFEYHSSWEWLMPVLEKICRTKISDGKEYVEYACPRTFGMIDKETGGIMVRLDGHQLFIADTLFEVLWLAIVNFIEGYNKDKK